MQAKSVIPIALVLVAFAACPNPGLAQSDKYPPCYTIRESKLRGCYLYSVTFEPSVIVWKGKEIRIKEAWFEHAHERLLIGSRKASGYNLCVNLSTGWDVLWDLTGNPPWFALEGQNGRGFGAMGTCVLWETFDKIESKEFNVLLTNNWQFANAVKIKVRVKEAASGSK
jgi:hypothetical protein